LRTHKFKHILTSVASPRSNGQVERYNRTLEAAINTSVKNENEWQSVLPDIIWGMNNTINSSTGFTPHRLMFGFDQSKHGELNVQVTQSDQQTDQVLAKNKMDKQFESMKKRFDNC
jgi:hypothetical protein